jgi:proteasome accessory factor A
MIRNNEKMTAVEIQRWYLVKAKEYAGFNPETVDKEVLEAWEEAVEKIAQDPRLLAKKVDWLIKRELLEAELSRWDANWNDYHRKIITVKGEEEYLSERLKMIELQYHDVRPEYGLYYLLESCGEVERLTNNEEIENAVFYPPEDTRAYFRGHCIRKFREFVESANWDCLVFNCGSEKPLERIRMTDPTKGTKALTGELIQSSRTAADLISKIKRE